MNSIPNEERVILAEIARPRGNRGEVLARSLTDLPGRLENLKSGWVRFADGSDRRVEFEEVWQHKENWVLKFVGIDSISDAERFSGSELWVPLSERGTPPEGEFFQSDLIGFEVIDEITGRKIGTVRGWQDYNGPLLMEVDAEGREILFPFTEAICVKVDLEARQVLVRPPEGLLEL